MELIADSGSSKTSWVLTKNGEISDTFRTVGLNPYFHSHESAVKVLKELLAKINGPINSIHFYGSGCSNEDARNLIREAIIEVFPDSNITVDHDLLAAARALCGSEPGLAAILGTGSNCCVYDGCSITKSRRALGYVLGDEGSGSYIGKQLLKDLLNDDLPAHIAKSFLQKFNLSDADILNALYKNDFPNRFLASLSPFVTQNVGEEYCYNLVYTSFAHFVDRCVLKFPEAKDYQLNVVGSVGYYSKDILQKVCSERNVNLGKVIREPIEELVTYHQRLIV